MRRKMIAEFLDNQPFAGPIRFRHQVVIALQLKPDSPGMVARDQCARLARNTSGGLQKFGRYFPSPG
jgi:hypothetical protein